MDEEKVWLPNEAFNNAAGTMHPTRVTTVGGVVDLGGRNAVLDNGGNLWYDKNWLVKDDGGNWYYFADNPTVFFDWKKTQTDGTVYRITRACIPYHAIYELVFDERANKTVRNI